MKHILSVKNLHIGFHTTEGQSHPISDISFDVEKGKTTALVGESGSGKSLSALSILRLLPYPQAFHQKGKIQFQRETILDGENPADQNKLADPKLIEHIRQKKIAFIFQEPMTALNPLHTVERLISESAAIANAAPPKNMRQYVCDLLKMVEFPNPESFLTRYPHQLSGGQRQRVMIALALACKPELLIADEPTTALDVTTQAQILDLLQKLQKEHNLTILFISHDLGIVRYIAHNIYVLYKGTVVESGTTKMVLTKPKHDYTKALVNSEPTGEAKALAKSAPTILEGTNINVHYGTKKMFSKVQPFHACKDVNFTLKQCETLGIVGESGSGKTTLALSLLRLISSKGEITLSHGDKKINLNALTGKALHPYRKVVQIVFQDPLDRKSVV